MQLLTNAPLENTRTALVRCDIDVPIKNGKILESYRLDAALPTLKFLLDKKIKPIICGHIGKPDGHEVPELSTKQLIPYFNEKLGENNFELLENLRFNLGEEQNSDDFARELSLKADIYVNESFATSHRKHASIVGVPKYRVHFPGLRFEQEIVTLSKVLKEPERPLVAIIGGSKLESKKPVVQKFLAVADYVLLGQKLGLDWKDFIPPNLVLPLYFNNNEADIGAQTIAKFTEIIYSAKTIIWAGPMGIFEEEVHAQGTREIAKAIAEADAFKVAGGGNTIDAIDRYGVADKIDFISTGGSAMLEYLARETLPGLEALDA